MLIINIIFKGHLKTFAPRSAIASTLIGCYTD